MDAASDVGLTLRPGPTPPAWFGLAMVVIFALVCPVAFAGDQGEAPLAAIGGALALPSVLRGGRPAAGLLAAAALAAWAAASFAWSPLRGGLLHVHRYAQLEALTAIKLPLQALLYGGFIYGALRLPAERRRQVLRGVTTAAVGLAVVLFIEAIEGGRIYATLNGLFHGHLSADLARRDAARGCYAGALLFWPLAAASWGKAPVGATVAVGAAFAVSGLMLGVDAPAAAMAAALLVFVAVRIGRRRAVWACAGGTCLYLLAAPLVFLPHGPAAVQLPEDVGKASWHVRTAIWRFASGLIVKRPLTGYGLDASRTWPDQIPMHPHDAAIQLWLETGVVGAVLGAGLFLWLFARIARRAERDPSWAAGAAAALTAYLVIGAISFGVWQEWWLALGSMTIALCGMTLQARQTQWDAPRPAALSGLEP